MQTNRHTSVLSETLATYMLNVPLRRDDPDPPALLLSHTHTKTHQQTQKDRKCGSVSWAPVWMRCVRQPAGGANEMRRRCCQATCT